MITLNEKKQSKQQNSPLALLLLAVLACIAAVTFRRSSGIWMLLPIYPLCIALSSVLSNYFPVKRLLRGVFFLVLTAALNLVESTDTFETAVIIGLAFACFLLVEFAVWLIGKKRMLSCIGGVALLVCYLFASSMFLGNPISAWQANSKLNEYINANYVTEGSGHQFESIRYDRNAGVYTVNATNTDYPTESRHIFLAGDHVVDHYRGILEDQEMRDTALAITEVLREAFPKDAFTVIRLGIDGFSDEEQAYSAHHETDYSSRMNFCIQLSGKPTYEKLLDAALSYNTVLASSNVSYGSVVFTGGEGLRFRMEITPMTENGIFREEMATAVYVLRHPDHYSHLEQNGIPDFFDRRLQVKLNQYT